MKQDKGQASRPPLCPVTSARSAGSSERFPGGRNWGQIQKEKMILRSHSPNAYCQKEPILSRKEKFAFYLTPEKKALLERRYQEDGSRSLTAFIENAVDFYLDYLSTNSAGLFLPASLKSYLDGRLGQLEDRLSSLTFKQAVEQDMVAGILADAFQFSEDDLHRRRAESVNNVKKTNGRISLEQRVREAWEEDDEWQD